MSVAPTARRWLLTGGVAAITVTGSLYGAGLKIKQDFKEEKKKFLEATPEIQIAHLEATRNELITRKNELERKIAQVSAQSKAAREADAKTK